MAVELAVPFPEIVAPFTDNRDLQGQPAGAGRINQIWLQLLITLWQRTGGAGGIDSEEALLLAVAGEAQAGSTSAQSLLLLSPGDLQSTVKEMFDLWAAAQPAPVDPLTALLFEVPAVAQSGVTGCCASWVPSVDGSEPPVFITDGAGNLIFVAYGP